MAGKDIPHDGASEPQADTPETDPWVTGPDAEGAEFESGLDYGAYIEEDEAAAEPVAADPWEGSPTESLDRTEALDGDPDAHRTEALDRDGTLDQTEVLDRDDSGGRADGTTGPDAGTQVTQSIDRAELDAWAASDAAHDRSAAQDRPAARARQGLNGTEPSTVSATADPDRGAEDPAAGTLWDSEPDHVDDTRSSTATMAAGAGAGAAVGTGAAAGYSGFATPTQPVAASEEDRRRELRDAEARALARDEALEGPTTGPRVLQVLLAVIFPIVVLIAAVRAVASPIFLWIEYHRPGFPADELGFTTDDRLTYGSAGMDFLFNAAPARYLGDLQHQGNQLFTDSEVSHMVDVKLVMLVTMAVGVVLALLSVVIMVVLARTTKGGIRRALFAGSLWMLVVLIVLAVLAVLGWQTFFAAFHSLFFADGTWTFLSTDALIRLYPNQFWMDAGIGIAALVLVTLIVTMVCTWPTRRRRQDSRLAQADLIRRRNAWYDGVDA